MHCQDSRHLVTVVLVVALIGPTTTRTVTAAAAEAPQQPQQELILKNADVVEMVRAGLPSGIIIEKIRHASVRFDVSTRGLVDLKHSGIPEEIMRVMIERPEGLAPLLPRSDTGQAQTTHLVSKPLDEIQQVLVKAPSEVLRTRAEQQLGESGGPVVNPTGSGYDALLIIGIDCGQQTRSMWTYANYTTCEGSVTLESGSRRVWSTTSKERSANSAKAASKLVDEMTREFVRAWKVAQKHHS